MVHWVRGSTSKGTFTNYVDKFLACFDHLPPTMAFSTLYMLTKGRHFLTTYPPLLVNVV